MEPETRAATLTRHRRSPFPHLSLHTFFLAPDPQNPFHWRRPGIRESGRLPRALVRWKSEPYPPGRHGPGRAPLRIHGWIRRRRPRKAGGDRGLHRRHPGGDHRQRSKHSTAVLMAMKDKMDLSLGIAAGSSLQVALLIAPILVFAWSAFGRPMDLEFTLPEVVSVLAAVVILAEIAKDGQTNWLEGAKPFCLSHPGDILLLPPRIAPAPRPLTQRKRRFRESRGARMFHPGSLGYPCAAISRMVA